MPWKLEIKSYTGLLLAMWSWAFYLTSLLLSFCICKTWVTCSMQAWCENWMNFRIICLKHFETVPGKQSMLRTIYFLPEGFEFQTSPTSTHRPKYLSNQKLPHCSPTPVCIRSSWEHSRAQSSVCLTILVNESLSEYKPATGLFSLVHLIPN